jgi:hypothetical protein
MKQERSSTLCKDNVWLGHIPSIIACIVSIIAIVQSCSANRLSKEANNISSRNIQIAETQLAAASMPILQTSYYVAKSPTLDMPEDELFIEYSGLSPSIIKSGYWRSIALSPPPDQVRYVFIIVSNYGPGTANRLKISGEWIPREGYYPPIGLLNLEGPPILLPPGRFLALMVDVIDSYDPSVTLETQLALHFQSLYLLITYEDFTGNPGSLEIDAPELPPAIIEPGI